MSGLKKEPAQWVHYSAHALRDRQFALCLKFRQLACCVHKAFASHCFQGWLVGMKLLWRKLNRFGFPNVGQAWTGNSALQKKIYMFCILWLKNGRVFVPRFWCTLLSRCIEGVLNGLSFGPAGRDRFCAYFFLASWTISSNDLLLRWSTQRFLCFKRLLRSSCSTPENNALVYWHFKVFAYACCTISFGF